MAEITKWYLDEDRETAKAYRIIKFENNREQRAEWIPKSEVTYLRKYPRDSKGVEIVFTVPDWLAEKRNL